MSTATATATDASPPPKKGKKKLIIMLAAVLLLVLLGGGGGTVFWLKKKAAAAAEAEAEGGEPAATKTAKPEAKPPPVFVALDMFTVNLADRDAERYAQVGITLEVEDAKVVEQLKTFMPAIRNHILLAIADRTAAELMDREGKQRLALEVQRVTSRALGIDVGDDLAGPDGGRAGKGKKTAKAAVALPVQAVHFSNFIIQ